MELYLVQHGEAKSEAEDPERPLSERGKKEAGKVARRLAESGIRPDEVFHSQKLRAKQTADIFSSALRSRSLEMQGLKPNDDPAIARDFVEGQGRSVMLVGHMPHLSRLASLLITGNPEHETISFRMGACVCLVKEERWKVKWILTPELA
ncbi:MAG: phosphohistidine phosphatase SixA [Candidatus Micrarchaeota archaeon]